MNTKNLKKLKLVHIFNHGALLSGFELNLLVYFKQHEQRIVEKFVLL